MKHQNVRYSKGKELLLVGRVVRAHGVRGEVKVALETDDPERLMQLEVIYAGPTPEQAVPHAVASARLQPTKRGLIVVLKLHEVDTREQAEALGKLAVFAREEDLPPLAEDEVFVHDLIGLRVETTEGEVVGTVHEVLEMPAHYVYVVAREGKEDVLVPAVPAFVDEIDLASERLVIRTIEGLLE